MALPAPAPVAPMLRRSVAFVLDGFILVPVYLVYSIVLDAALGVLVEPDPTGTVLVVVAVDPFRVALELTLTLLTDAAYFAGCWSRWGMTPGQRACGVAVRADAPGPEGSVRAARVPPRVGPSARPSSGPSAGPERLPLQGTLVRWAVLQVPSLCVGSLGGAGAISLEAVGLVNGAWFGLLLVSALADPLRRGLHDRAGGTVVLRSVPLGGA